MSYRCDNCGCVRYGKEIKRISEVRNVEYTRIFTRIDRRTKDVVEKINGSYSGLEAAEEQKLCEDCYDKLKDVEPKVEQDTKTVKFIGSTRRKSFDDNKKPSGNKPDYEGLKRKFNRRDR